MLSPEAVATVAVAGVGGAATVAIWAIRLEGRMNTHEATDNLMHTHIKESLDRIEVRIGSKKETRATD